MDHDQLLMKNSIENGRKLIDLLESNGFEVRVAFWTKLSEDGSWVLQLASPFVEKNGYVEAYRLAFTVLRQSKDLGIVPDDVRIVAAEDQPARVALSLSKVGLGENVATNEISKSYPGGTWYGGSMLGGISIEKAYIYPTHHLATAA